MLDNLERGLEAAKSATDFDSMKQGIVMTRKMFEDTLGGTGFAGSRPSGKPLTRPMHEAMQQVETTDLPPNYVVQEARARLHAE